jgi:hypothetical protein
MAGIRPLNIGVRYWDLESRSKLQLVHASWASKRLLCSEPLSAPMLHKSSAAVHPLGQLFALPTHSGRATFEAADPNYRALPHPIASVS